MEVRTSGMASQEALQKGTGAQFDENVLVYPRDCYHVIHHVIEIYFVMTQMAQLHQG